MRALGMPSVVEWLGTGVLLMLAIVLVLAALAKVRPAGVRRRTSTLAQAAAESALAAAAILAPSVVAGLALACAFVAFTCWHAWRWRQGARECGCFGPGADLGGSARRAGAITAASAVLAAVAGLSAPPRFAQLASIDPAMGVLVVSGALLGAVAWRAAFTAHRPRPGTAAEMLVTSSAGFLERRLSRRSMLSRVALVGSALAVAPLRYLLYPVTAMAAIAPGDCAGGLCTDGFTAFCCQINSGLNSCPEGTFPGGWWMCTDYAGRRLCAEQGVRYYVDCNALPGTEYPGGCTCAGGSCENQRVACNVFRYGQCNTQIAGTTAVVCRMVLCENPGSVPHLNCSSSVAVDDLVCGQDTPCLEPPAVEPRATELAGAGGA